jgi:hypothetical protein
MMIKVKDYFRSPKNNNSQPAIKPKPPKGVTGPAQATEKGNKSRQANR